MLQRKILFRAIAMATGTTAGMASLPANAEKVLEEVMVTATKQSASMQDIPVAVQAITEENLKTRGIENFSDYVQQLPNVEFAGRGPGQNDVFVRGIAATQGSLFQAGGIGAKPTVAFYFDEAPMTAAGRNIDVYVTDIARVEVLAGPQGTLYGGSSQSGTVRMITNKPDPGEFSGSVTFGGASINEGSTDSKVEAVINVPIVEDKVALRIAAYDKRNGGYIDNVYGEVSMAENRYIRQALENESLIHAWGVSIAPDTTFDTTNNRDLLEEDFNESTYSGARMSLAAELDDDWDLLLGFMTQELTADGVFDYSPEKGDLQVSRFSPDRLLDQFDQFNWTLNGQIGELQLIYTGSYLEREIQSNIDYVGYARLGSFQPWYNCNYFDSYDQHAGNYNPPGAIGEALGAYAEVTHCTAPQHRYAGYNETEMTTHEFRISTDQSKDLRFTGGVYIDDEDIGVSAEWSYHNPNMPWAQNSPNQSIYALQPGFEYFNPGPRPLGTSFFNDLVSHSEQIAFFGELSYDINDHWSVTVGYRDYEMKYSTYGSANFATLDYAVDPVAARQDPYLAQDGDGGPVLAGDMFDTTEDDSVMKFTVNYTPNEDVLLYATYSEGFRRGGFNRAGDVTLPFLVDINRNGVLDEGESLSTWSDKYGSEWQPVPGNYQSDTIENYEFGWKATLLDGRLRWNGTIYRIDWSDVQIDVFNNDIFNLFFTANAGEAEVFGSEGDITYLLTDNWMIIAAYSFNDTELTDKPVGDTSLQDVGTDLPLTARFQGNINARYDYSVKNNPAFVQLSMRYKGSSHTSLLSVDPFGDPQDFPLDSYTLFDFTLGVTMNDWDIKAYVHNITDERAELFKSDQDDEIRIVVAKPRTIGASVTFNF